MVVSGCIEYLTGSTDVLKCSMEVVGVPSVMLNGAWKRVWSHVGNWVGPIYQGQHRSSSNCQGRGLMCTCIIMTTSCVALYMITACSYICVMYNWEGL